MAELDHTRLRFSLGSYVLGSLEPVHRAAVDAHLAECSACREELASYASLPALMSRLTLAEVRRPPLPVPPAVLSWALDAVAAERDRSLSQLRRWRAATVLAAAAAIIVGVLLGATVMRGSAQSPPSSVPLVAEPGSRRQAPPPCRPNRGAPRSPCNWTVYPKETGSRRGSPLLTGRAASPPPGQRPRMDTASLTGAASIPEAQLASLQVMQGQTALLTLARPR